VGINDQIREFITRELMLDQQQAAIDDETPLMEEAVIDSLGVFKLAAFLEQQFGIEIHDNEMVPEHFGSVSSLSRLVESKRTGAGRS